MTKIIVIVDMAMYMEEEIITKFDTIKSIIVKAIHRRKYP